MANVSNLEHIVSGRIVIESTDEITSKTAYQRTFRQNFFYNDKNYAIEWDIEIYKMADDFINVHIQPQCNMEAEFNEILDIGTNTRIDLVLLGYDGVAILSKGFESSAMYTADYSMPCFEIQLLKMEEFDYIEWHHNSRFVLDCKITVIDPFIKAEKVKNFGTIPMSSLGTRMLEYSLDSTFTDLHIELKEKIIHAHRAVLASASPVFKQMFADKNWTESREGIIRPKDVSDGAMNALIIFCYGNEVAASDLEEHAQDLLAASHMYEMPDLIKLCVAHLIKSLTPKSVADMLLLSHCYGQDQLKDNAIACMRQHLHAVVSTDEWSELCFDHPALAVDAIRLATNE